MQDKKQDKKPAGKTNWRIASDDYGRKFRPKTINDIIGQGMVKYALKGMVRKKHVPGAILAHGPRGCGKTTIARIIAAMLNCDHLTEDGNPCGVCESCSTMWSSDKTHPDYIEINCASDTGIDVIRGLKERLGYQPRYNKTVVALDEIHKLSKAAQEAALKMMEEPRDHVRYILATTDKQGIIQTMLSRCTQFELSAPALKDCIGLMIRVCKEEKLVIGEDILEALCTSVNNIPRECLNALQRLSLILASGEVKTKDITLENLSGELSEVLGLPNYACVKDFLVSMYHGRLSACVLAAQTSQNKTTMLKSCIDTHTNIIAVMSTKKPDKLFPSKQALGYMKHLLGISHLEPNFETLKKMSAVLTDMIDMYSKAGQYQLGDSSAPLVSLASKWCLRFKGESE